MGLISSSHGYILRNSVHWGLKFGSGQFTSPSVQPFREWSLFTAGGEWRIFNFFPHIFSCSPFSHQRKFQVPPIHQVKKLMSPPLTKNKYRYLYRVVLPSGTQYMYFYCLVYTELGYEYSFQLWKESHI